MRQTLCSSQQGRPARPPLLPHHRLRGTRRPPPARRSQRALPPACCQPTAPRPPRQHQMTAGSVNLKV